MDDGVDIGNDIARTDVADTFALRYDRWCRWLCVPLGLGPRFSRVTVGDRQLAIRMGCGFDAVIPLAQVVGVERAVRPFVGWGVHGWRGRWLVNGSLQGLVSIAIDPPARGRVVFVPVRLREVVVSLADPDRFQAALAPSGR